MRRLSFPYLFWIVAILRFSSIPPFVIDDDEAWWSAAANVMKSPADFYRSAVDHKPPGVVWFYWLVNHLIPCASDPRVVRAAYTLVMIAAAGVLGWIAFEIQKKKARRTQRELKPVGWIAATFFLIITAIPTPKLMAVTADGMIAALTVFAYAIALFIEFPAVSVVCGMILGLALLVKQTAVFFCIPILFAKWPRKWSFREILGFAAGSLLVVVPSIFAVGASDFFYWNWTYPKQVLITVREQLFHSTLEMFESLGLFALATLPLLVLMIRSAIRAGKAGVLTAFFDFRVLWLISGVVAALLGKGLFLHYLLLFTPPFALLAADAWASANLSLSTQRKTLTWIGAQYVLGVLLLMIPASGIFWGTDLVYFEELSRVMKSALKPESRVLVWGGSALPLTYTGAPHITRFVLPRFAVPPYATERTREMFHEELAQEQPELVLDLHERGDNQFNNPIESEPVVARMVRGYRVYVSQSVPWAKFYFRNPPPGASGLVELQGTQQVAAAYAAFPRETESWMRLMTLGKQEGAEKLGEVDWALRAGAALELLSRQGKTDEIRSQARALFAELRPQSVSPDLTFRIERFIREETGSLPPFPLVSRAWWPSVALVELQPKAFKLAP